MDFATIKANVRIVDVLGRRGISLRYNGEWGSAVCPLPTHKSGDRDKTFQVNVKQNYFKCWSASCNEKAGKKGGGVINLVALLENCSEYDAAKKLVEMFHVGASVATSKSEPAAKLSTKTAQQIAGRDVVGKQTHHKDSPDDPSASDSVKDYMSEVDAWLDALFKRAEGESDDAYRKRLLNGIKGRLIGSYRAGQKMKIA